MKYRFDLIDDKDENILEYFILMVTSGWLKSRIYQGKSLGETC